LLVWSEAGIAEGEKGRNQCYSNKHTPDRIRMPASEANSEAHSALVATIVPVCIKVTSKAGGVHAYSP
jgi:hypothetical protein